ncbi:hypothetical protein JXA32_01275 [Candidatus Sumerlaeota bacterium]|nr:hypothetical protein [Candidatus Sumerlaeota bacterium]
MAAAQTTLLIVAPLRAERDPLRRELERLDAPPQAIRVERLGVGRDQTLRNLNAWVQRLAPQKIVLFGSCGWIAETPYAPGRLFAIDRAIDGNNPQRIARCDEAWTGALCAALDLPRENIVTTNDGVIDSSVARQLYHATHAPLVDMETYHAAAWCAERGISFAALRAVTDPAGANAENTFHQNLHTVMTTAAKKIAPILSSISAQS